MPGLSAIAREAMNQQLTTNALTVDVEDYFQVSAFEPHISRSDWDSVPCRIERNMDRILDLFGEFGCACNILYPRLDC